jgi:4,5-DOPA dioxygenase extradiol
MPVLFVGHGSPMNAIETNSFTHSLKDLGRRLPIPKAIVCVSAHWMTEGTWVTRMARPKTIHDFYGFPKELFDVQYPAPGAPEIADRIRSTVQDPQILVDDELWGLDHGAWSVLRHLYPEANVPVLQLSVYMEQPGEYHYKVGQALQALRNQGIFVIGSGNIVHNLRQIRWEPDATPFDWAVDFDQWAKENMLAGNHQALISEYLDHPAGRASVPTPDHYYPLLYTLGAADRDDKLTFPWEGIQNSSISMRAVLFSA